MENLGKVTLALITLITVVVSSFLSSYVILQIASVYGLNFITQFSFIQVYGLLFIVTIINTKSLEKEKEIKKPVFLESVIKIFKQIGKRTFFLLMGWGLAWIMFQILS